MLSAKLVVSFSKPKKMTEEEYEKELSAYMKPISDTENVVFNTKMGVEYQVMNCCIQNPVK